MKSKKEPSTLKSDILEELVIRYSHSEFIKSDPIFFAHGYESERDIEIVSFISALFSYGNVQSIKSHISHLLATLGNSPYNYILNGNLNSTIRNIRKYRFQTSEDIYFFLRGLSSLLKKSQNGSLEEYFDKTLQSVTQKICFFQNFLAMEIVRISGKVNLSYGLKFLIGSAKPDASHKRYNMFLRWMVRKNFPDFGIYDSIAESELLFPLDVHILRMGKILDLTNRKSIDRKQCELITDGFKKINADDPLRFDFPLSRLGILKKCKGSYFPPLCEICDLKRICSIYRSKKI